MASVNNDLILSGLLTELPAIIAKHEGYYTENVIATKSIHSGHHPKDHSMLGNPVIPPITLSTTFEQTSAGVYKVYHRFYATYTFTSVSFCSTTTLEEIIIIVKFLNVLFLRWKMEHTV